MAANQCQQNYKMSDKDIKVPNIGEFKDVEVIEVLVSNGQSVSKNDPLITIESDKSSVEIPASFAYFEAISCSLASTLSP
jgi:pyruvate dehydrogenase E2 component (dihydrolipoamide acetyltransferase)